MFVGVTKPESESLLFFGPLLARRVPTPLKLTAKGSVSA